MPARWCDARPFPELWHDDKLYRMPISYYLMDDPYVAIR